MEVITYLLGIELVRIEHRTQGRDAGFQVLITHSNCIQQFFCVFRVCGYFWLPIISGRIQDIALITDRF